MKSYNVDDVIDTIRTIAVRGDLPEFLCDAQITSDTMLYELGLDSLGQLVLFEEITEGKLGTMPDGIDNMSTLSELIDLLNLQDQPNDAL